MRLHAQLDDDDEFKRTPFRLTDREIAIVNAIYTRGSARYPERCTVAIDWRGTLANQVAAPSCWRATPRSCASQVTMSAAEWVPFGRCVTHSEHVLNQCARSFVSGRLLSTSCSSCTACARCARRPRASLAESEHHALPTSARLRGRTHRRSGPLAGRGRASGDSATLSERPQARQTLLHAHSALLARDQHLRLGHAQPSSGGGYVTRLALCLLVECMRLSARCSGHPAWRAGRRPL